jgi:hypothetical protein
MNRDDIIQLAWESGDCVHIDENGCKWMYESDLKVIERFAALVAAHEREACEKVCEEKREEWGWDNEGEIAIRYCVNAIRARGKQSVGKSEQVPTVCDDYLEKCPNCNGIVDNGFDRSWPNPDPCFCKKCMKEME